MPSTPIFQEEWQNAQDPATLPIMSRTAALTPSPHPPPPRAIAAMRDELVGLLERIPGSGGAVAKLMRLLGDLERELEAAHARAEAPQRSRGPRRTEVVSHYRVEGGVRGDRSEALAEHRSSGAQPFRCPWRIYEAAARELSAATDGMGFEDLHARVNKRLGEEVPIYRIRMCLRFWAAAETVEHWLKVFKPIHRAGARGGFIAEAKWAWDRARAESIRPQPRKHPDAHPHRG